MEWKGKRADEILSRYAQVKRSERVEIKLHDVQTHKENLGLRRRVMLVAGYAVAAAVVLGVFVLVERPQRIYGHVNGVPVTDKEEAIRHSRQMFEDLAVGMAPAEEMLGNLFSL